MLSVVLLLPLLVAIIAIALGDWRHAKYIALGSSLVTLALLPFSTGPATVQWLSIGGAAFDIVISTQQLNLMLMALVSFMIPFALFYSFGYINLPSAQKRFYAEMLAFETAMLLFAMSGSFVTLFIAWEFLSMTSYLLIGFWYNREKAVRAARKVVSIILFGDIALFASLVLFFAAYGTLDFSQIISEIGSSNALAYAAVSLLVVAIFTKSAQFPFHEWLADAMEGPVPVSAMLHSATMVKAGVFAALVLLPLISAAHLGNFIVAVGLFTAIIATLDALREKHVKKALAYSTVQELSIMLVAVGANALLAAVYFFIAQSFYKSMLFFTAGDAMSATGKENVGEVNGLTSNKLLFLSALFGVLALAGFVPFDGFFANIGVGSAFTSNLIAYALLSLVSLLTSFFIFRWLVLCSRPVSEKREAILYSGLPKSMIIPGLLLALLALAASALFFFMPSLFNSLQLVKGKPILINVPDALIETAIVNIGGFAAWLVYRKERENHLLNRRLNHLQTTRAFNIAYALIASFFYALAAGFYYFDAYLDSLFNLIAHGVNASAKAMRYAAQGQLGTYVAIFIAGFLLVMLVLVV
ncbi:MAG: proton-conducting transporter membrane subunit [Candidatus Micrarchaeaceae archaeon]